MSRRAVVGLMAAILALAVVACGEDGDDDDRAADVRTVESAPADRGDPSPPPVDDAKRDRGKRARGRPEPRPEPEEPPRGPPREYPVSGNVAYPNDVTQSGGEIARIIERHLGAVAPKADQLTLIGADCRAGACSARYVSGPHGGGRILSDAAVILGRAFARRSVRSVKLYVHEPHGRQSERVEPMALAVITCRRADHPEFTWRRLDDDQLDQRCTVVEQSPGKLGSKIKKGELSEHEASRGNSGR